MFISHENLTKLWWQCTLVQHSKYQWFSHGCLSLHIWEPLQCILVAPSVTSLQKEKQSTPRDDMSSYFWVRHSRGMWHVEWGRGKAPARESMRNLITSSEEASAVYLSFLHDYIPAGLTVVELCGLSNGFIRPCSSEGEEGRRFCGWWCQWAESCSASQIWPLSRVEVCQKERWWLLKSCRPWLDG